MKPKIERRNKMKKNKGFTLIELLAVIVILAIIALIAVPVVMNIINSANKSAFKDSAYGILKAGELFYTDSLLENAGNATETTFTFPNNIEGLEFKGSKPSKGSMTVNKDGKVAMAITNGKYCITKGFEDDDVVIKEDDGNCELPVPALTLSDLATTGTFKTVDERSESTVSEVDACATSGTCEAGTAFAIKVNNNEIYKFYVLSDTGSEVTLIMDRNLYSSSDENNGVAWYKEDDDDATNNETNDQGPLTALSVLNQRTSNWTNIPKITVSTYEKYDFSTNTETQIPLDKSYEMRARLPKFNELDLVAEANIVNGHWPDFMAENLRSSGDNNQYSYWTSTILDDNENYALGISAFGGDMYDPGYQSLEISSDNNYYGEGYGVRPIIALSK